jgi:ribosomal-protein-alanine N-acetyltransferase
MLGKAEKRSFQLRYFNPNDLNRVVEINLKTLPENYPPSFFINLHESYPKTFLVAEIDGEIVGYVMCRMELGLSLPRFKMKGHVVSIAVVPEHRRRGIGSSLMKKVLEEMKSEYGASECYLEVRASNVAAINMYEKLGFRVVSRLKHYYLDGEDAYLMRMLL